MSAKEIERVEISAERVAQLLERAKAALGEEDYRDLENLVKTLAYLTGLVEKGETTMRQLRKFVFGFKSEKLRKVLEKISEVSDGGEKGEGTSEETNAQVGAQGDNVPADPVGESAREGAQDEAEVKGEDAGEAKAKPKGHGRNGADAYEGAERQRVGHATLKAGDPCPEPGCDGKVYLFVPRQIVRIVGQAPVMAKVTEIEQLRCNLCLKVFAAEMPRDVGPEKYDATAASMIAILRYGTGVPFNRLAGLERNLKIPLPASTQWDVVERAAKRIAPAYAEILRQAAQGDVLHNDDTAMKILEIMRENRQRKEGKSDDG